MEKVRILFFEQFSMGGLRRIRIRANASWTELVGHDSKDFLLFFCLHFSALNQTDAVRKMESKKWDRGMWGRMGRTVWSVIPLPFIPLPCLFFLPPGLASGTVGPFRRSLARFLSE
jgi:hypothetical protein